MEKKKSYLQKNKNYKNNISNNKNYQNNIK